MISKLLKWVSLSLIFCSSPVFAATLVVNSSGIVTGAMGVDVDGALYDVAFQDGSCNTVFNGCTPSAFAFNTSDEAFRASFALMLQVLRGTSPAIINGCPDSYFPPNQFDQCSIYTPYTTSYNPSGLETVLNQVAIVQSNGMSYAHGISQQLYRDQPLSFAPNYYLSTFAVWSPSPVPLPASAWLFATGLVGLTGLARKRRK